VARAREGLLWVPIFEDLFDNPKTIRLAARTKLDIVTIAGHLVALWVWSVRHRPSGIYEPDEGCVIAIAMRWPTDRATDGEAMVGAMRDEGWLDTIKGGKSGTRIELHDWPKYAGLLKSVMRARQEAMTTPIVVPMGDRSEKSSQKPAVTVDRRPGTVDRDRRPETKDLSASSRPTDSPPNKEPAPTPDFAPLRGLMLYEQDTRLLDKFPALLPAWTRSYPGINVSLEIARAHSWEISNPKRRKIDHARFLNSWLSRAQDKSSQGPTNGPTAPAVRRVN